ncbi:MAG TPA: hypothetical protein VGR11_04825 [Solirubrobacteraceae bacterium]|nr:hypothetical protein [Solirubrobacteraceae bacterium]
MIKAEYGPTLLALLAPRHLAVRVAAAVIAIAILVAAVVIAVTSRPDETAVLIRKPITLNFAYGPQWTPVDRAGTLVALRHESPRGLFLDAYAIRELTLPPYRGAASGMLPVYADGYRRTLPRRYREFELVGEGRARINNAIGYALTFRARSGTRRLYARHYLLVEEEPEGRRQGVVLEIESTPAAGTPNADAIGNHGALKTPLRSFRFGKDRTGGTA